MGVHISEEKTMKKSHKFVLPIFLATFGLLLSACSLDINGQHGNDNPEENQPANEFALTAIEITKNATKLKYNLNEPLDTAGLQVTAVFEPHKTEVVPNDKLVFSGFNSSTAGVKKVTISYTYGPLTKSTFYQVKVVDSNAQGKNVTLDFYAFNDIHGNIVDSSMGIGISKTATMIKEKSAGKNPVLISSGDMWQGSIESNSTRGALMSEWMQYMNFSSMTLGNHEFDWGTKFIKQNATNYEVPILGINIIDKTTGQRADYAAPSTVIERDGAKIGIIGAIGDCYNSISYSQVMDVSFVVDKEGQNTHPLSELIKAESIRLRSEENCDFIVYSVHGDSFHDDTYYNPELSSGGYVDVVLEGHKHAQVNQKDSSGIYHFQALADGHLNVNHFTVNLNTGSDEYTVNFNASSDVYDLRADNMYDYAVDPGVEEIINQYDFSKSYEPIGYNTDFRSGSQMRQLCADLYLKYAQEKWTNYANNIVLGGGYISIRGVGYLPAGFVRYADFYTLFPFDNDILLIKINGTVLQEVYFDTTNSNYFMGYSEYGETLRNNRSQISASQMYFVVADTYTYDWMLKYNKGAVLVDRYSENGYYARDMLADFAREGGFGGVIEVLPDIIHAGTVSEPYTASEAYSLVKSGNSYVHAYVKGVISDVSSAYLEDGIIYDVAISDSEDSEFSDIKINIVRINRYDGASEDKNWTSLGQFATVGKEVLIYGNLWNKNDEPVIDDALCISINDTFTSGMSIDDPTSVVQYNAMQTSQVVYVQGAVYGLDQENDGTITRFDLSTDYSPHSFIPLDSFITISQNITYAEGINPKAITYETVIICKLSSAGCEIVSIVSGANENIHTGSIDDPFTVGEALHSARETGCIDSSVATWYYCRGVVTRAGTALGYDGDIGFIYIGDDKNNEIMIYYLSKFEDADSTANFQSYEDIKVGDELLIYGPLFMYQGETPEFGGNTYCISINGVATNPSA